MTNIYKGPFLKLAGKIILTAAMYAIAYGVSKRIWR